MELGGLQEILCACQSSTDFIAIRSESEDKTAIPLCTQKPIVRNASEIRRGHP